MYNTIRYKSLLLDLLNTYRQVRKENNPVTKEEIEKVFLELKQFIMNRGVD